MTPSEYKSTALATGRGLPAVAEILGVALSTLYRRFEPARANGSPTEITGEMELAIRSIPKAAKKRMEKR